MLTQVSISVYALPTWMETPACAGVTVSFGDIGLRRYNSVRVPAGTLCHADEGQHLRLHIARLA